MVRSGLAVARDKSVASTKIGELQKGDLVEIVEIKLLQREQCSRGKLAKGG